MDESKPSIDKALRAIAPAHRRALLRELLPGPLTSVALARRLQTFPWRLAYDLRVLREAGLIVRKGRLKAAQYALNSELLERVEHALDD